MKKITISFLSVLILFAPAYAQKAKDGNRYKEIVYAEGYEHDKWKISHSDHIFKFRAYICVFRRISSIHSELNRPPIPIHSVHPFRRIPST